MSGPLLLCYHALSEEWSTPLAVRPGDFESHMRSLRDRGLRGVTVAEAIAAGPDSRVVGLSFDDAFASVLRFGLPALERLGFRATMFVPTGFVGARELDWPGLYAHGRPADRSDVRPMTWSEIRELAGAGWEIGSHTVSHPSLPDLDEHEIARELETSRAELADRLDHACETVAYPYGHLDERTRRSAERAGYSRGVATLPGRLRTPRSRYEWPRLVVNRVDAPRRFSLKTSNFTLRVRTTRAWESVVRGRRVIRRRKRGKSS